MTNQPTTDPAAAVPSTTETATSYEPDPPSGLRERADAIRTQHNYDGTLTPTLLLALEPLLREPTPRRYVKHMPPTTGKPYESTGLNSVQVQVDRMNDVLGAMHWRSLTFYAEHGTVCKVVVIVGNRLAHAKLDSETGELEPGDAEILLVRDGWGGHERGSHKGDVLKGAETNALKRVLARVGPGSDVYRLDFDNDTHGDGPRYQPQATDLSDPAVGVKRATAAQVRLIQARAAKANIGDVGLCNIICRAAGGVALSEAEAVEAMNGGLLERLPANLVDAVLAGIAQGAPAPAPASSDGGDVPVPDLRVVPGGASAPTPPPNIEVAPLVPASQLVPGQTAAPASQPDDAQQQADAPAQDPREMGAVDPAVASRHLSFTEFGPGSAAPPADSTAAPADAAGGTDGTVAA